MQRLLAAAACIALAAVPPVTAVTLLEDPAGDVVADVYGEEAPVPADAVDLVALEVEERADAFVLRVAFAPPSDPAPPGEAEPVDAWVVFRHGGHAYAVQVGARLEGADKVGHARLYALEPPGPTPRFLSDLSEASWDDRLFGGAVPRDLLRDEQGAPPLQGALLEDVAVFAQSVGVDGPDPERGFFCCTEAAALRDRMPDDPAAAAAYRVATGGREHTGPLEMEVTPAYQATNGFGDVRLDVTLRNIGDTPLHPSLAVTGRPAAWQVESAAPATLDAGEEVTLPVIVRTSSAHRHGATTDMWLEAEDAAAGAQARHVVGVHILEVPHPAGHHARLWMHSRDAGTQADSMLEALGYAPGLLWMNTLREDPDGDAVPVDSTHSEFGGTSARWSICLVPGPALELDFDATRTGALKVAFSAGRPYGEVVLAGRLLHFGPGAATDPCDADVLAEGRNETVLAEVAATPPQELDGATGFTADLVPTAAADLVAHVPGAVLLLELEALFEVQDSQGPGPLVLEPGGSLRLPLLDVVEDVPPLSRAADPRPPANTTQPPVPDKETPAPIALAAAVALALVAACRRARP